MRRNLFAQATPPQNQWSTPLSQTGLRRICHDDAIAVNGMRGARRSACPARLVLATSLGGDIDGAWWPRVASVAVELPELVEALHRPLGEILDIRVNWSATEQAPDLSSMTSYAMSMPGWRHSRQRLMVISGRRAGAKLLVVPHLTSSALALMVLRRAASMPIPDAQQLSAVFQTADCVVRAARAESASWACRTPDGQVAESQLRQGSHSGHASSDA